MGADLPSGCWPCAWSVLAGSEVPGRRVAGQPQDRLLTLT